MTLKMTKKMKMAGKCAHDYQKTILGDFKNPKERLNLENEKTEFFVKVKKHQGKKKNSVKSFEHRQFCRVISSVV